MLPALAFRATLTDKNDHTTFTSIFNVNFVFMDRARARLHIRVQQLASARAAVAVQR
jgi:hypothetical protein